jgi:hypothetical protein
VKLTLPEIARALDGEMHGGRVLAPGPRHSDTDRSLSITLSTSAPEGFLVHSFAGDDDLACSDYVRSRLNLPQWKPNRSAATRQFDFRDPRTGEIQRKRALALWRRAASVAP